MDQDTVDHDVGVAELVVFDLPQQQLGSQAAQFRVWKRDRVGRRRNQGTPECGANVPVWRWQGANTKGNTPRGRDGKEGALWAPFRVSPTRPQGATSNLPSYDWSSRPPEAPGAGER